MASAFGIFLLRQTFKAVPRELDEAARVEGAGPLQVLLKVYVPLAKPVYIAYGLVSVSYHWNNFLWPLIVTNSVNTRPLTVGLQIFASTDQGIDWSVITAATLMTRRRCSSPSCCSSGNSCKVSCAPEFADAGRNRRRLDPRSPAIASPKQTPRGGFPMTSFTITPLTGHTGAESPNRFHPANRCRNRRHAQ